MIEERLEARNDDREFSTFPKFGIPRKVWRVLYPSLIFLGVQFVVGIVWELVGGVIVAIRLTADPAITVTTEVVTNEMMAWVSGTALEMAIAGQIVSLICMLPMWLKTRKYLPKFERRNLPVATVIAILAPLAIGVFAGYLWSLTGIEDPMSETIRELFTEQLTKPLWMQILSTVVLAAATEEICFRGITLNRSLYWMPQWAAVLIASVLFAAAHMNFYQAIPAMCSGAVMAVIYIRYRSIWLCVAAHFANNLLATLQSNFFTNAEMELTPGAATFELILTILGIGAFILMFFVDGATPIPPEPAVVNAELDVNAEPEASDSEDVNIKKEDANGD